MDEVVNKQDWKRTPTEAVELLQSYPIVLAESKLQLESKHGVISRNGDLVVGFIYNGKKPQIIVDMIFGGQSMPKLTLKSGVFSYFNSIHKFFPIIAVSYSMLYMTCQDMKELEHISVVYALIADKKLRQDIALDKECFKKYLQTNLG